MKTFDTTSVSGLLGETITCGHVTCTETATLRLNNTIKIADDYVYQIVIKSASTSNIVLKIGTQSFNLASTTSWQRLIQKFTIENNNTNYIDLIFSPGEYWFYNAKLETGIIATAWTPAPEDFDIKLYSLQSEFNQRADQIEMSISSKQDTTGTAIRYIRDWLNGSNVDDENRWIECKVMSNGVDIAEGLIPVCNDLKHSNITIDETELSKYTDSLTLSSNYISSTGNHYLLLDLGEIYYDIDYIQVWHGYSKDKEYRYNHKLQISNDGITWFTLYDSSVSGGYSENSEGRIHYISSGTIISNMANMSLKLNEISSSVSKVDGELSEIKQQSNNITTTLGNNKEAIERLDNNFLELSTNVHSQNKSNADQFTKIIERISGVETRVGKTEGDITDISDVLQTADAWKAIFRHLGVDENIKETHISFDIDGITVTNPLNGQVTKMKIDGFSGWYNNEKVFWIENDTTKTIRLLCEKGWDTNFIKMTTNDYLYADGRHLKGTAYVKSGGTS